MKVTVDLSGLDSFIQEVEDEINQGLIDAAHKAVDTQKVRNESGKKTYENHTWNLRNAPGAAVIQAMGKSLIYMFRQTGSMLKRKLKPKTF